MTLTKSARRNGRVFLSIDFLIVTKYASTFSDSYQICQHKWGLFLLADLLTIRQYASRNGGVFLPTDFLIVTKSASRFIDSYQICQHKWGLFLLADLLTVRKSASRNGGYFCQQIYCHQKYTLISASRFPDCLQIW